MSQMGDFINSSRCIQNTELTEEDVQRTIEQLEAYNRNRPVDKGALQKILDFLGSPIVSGDLTYDDALIAGELQRGYWSAIALRDQHSAPQIKVEINKHVHVHVDGKESLTQSEKVAEITYRRQLLKLEQNL